jgi:hypothetical protein
MSLSNVPFFSQGLYQAVQTVVNSDTSTVKALTTTQANGVRIKSIIATSTDTSNQDLQLSLTISSTNYGLVKVQVPATAGTVNSVVPVNVLKGGVTPGSFPGLAYDENGNPYIDLPSGSTLSINTGGTVTSGKQINVIATGELY